MEENKHGTGQNAENRWCWHVNEWTRGLTSWFDDQILSDD
jgi:hypothetical protein